MLAINPHEMIDVSQNATLSCELLQEIFFQVNFQSILTIRAVCLNWKSATINVDFERKYLFSRIKITGLGEWAHMIGAVIDKKEESIAFSQLPSDIFKILCNPSPASPESGKAAAETCSLVYIPDTVNGLKVNLMYLGTLLQRNLPVSRYPRTYQGYRLILREVLEKYNVPQESGYWVLAPKNLLENSKSKTEAEQEQLAKDIAKNSNAPYAVAKTFELVAILVANFLEHNENMIGGMLYARCQESFSLGKVVVGLQHDGLSVFSTFPRDDVGAVFIRRLS